MTISCLPFLRRMALVSAYLHSSFAFATTPPVFPVLQYEPYAVDGALAVADGDVNGDGVNDTVYISLSRSGPGGSTVTSALRSKAGGSPVIVAGGAFPCSANSLLLADLNKDGKLDAVATCAEGSVAVMQGNGDGHFQSASLYTISSAAKAVVADLNGDGFPDVVVATNTGNSTSTFAVLLNQGSAGPIMMGKATVYGGATGSTQLITGDINGDGKQDIVAGGTPEVHSGAFAAIFYGNGDGTLKAGSFSIGDSFAVGNNVTPGDFDGDGVTDLASVSGDVSYSLLTQVNVNFGTHNKIGTILPVPVGIVSLHAVDVNNDGHLDLVLAGTTTTVLLGDGKGNLSIGPSYATPGSYYGTRKSDTGKTNLVFATPRGFYTLNGDGNGNFDGLPAFFSSDAATAADTNGDGLTDVVASEQTLGIQISAIGRGNGTFAVLNKLTNQLKAFPTLTDLNGDGVVDLVEIYSNGGSVGNQAQSGQSRLVSSMGTGDGRFLRSGAGIDLAVKGAASAVAGDFDGDGKQDLIVSYLDTTAGATNVSGLVLIRGHGDGTFVASPVNFATSTTAVHGRPLAADLNGDGKPDLVWGNTAYLNRGDGTFSPLTLPVQGTAMAVADLNGDGVADLLLDNSIYAGNGDGTFQAAPLYTVAAPQASTIVSASVGDLNGDGSADVIVQYMGDLAGLSVAFGDGKGNFTADTNVYTTGSKMPASGTLARLNNQAPALLHDNRTDYIVFADGAAVSLLNQTNPRPAAPAPLPSKLTLSVSSNSAVPLQPVTLASTVTGLDPTGTITFATADGAILGKEPVGSSNVDLQPSFASAGSYTVTATYSGDSNNAPSASNPVTVTVAKGPSVTQLRLSPGNFYARRTITLSAFVSGYNPTAQVTFAAGGTPLGTAPVLGGIASLPYRFVDPGSYQITASYPGDASNLPSASDPGTLNIVVGPDFSMTLSPASNTVKAGDTATYTLTITPLNGYAGAVQLGCASGVSSANCSLSSVQVPVMNGTPSTLTITIKTASPTNNQPRISLYGTMGAVLLLFGWKKRWRRMGPRLHRITLALCLAVGLLAMSACSSSPASSVPTSPGTTYNIVISGSDADIETSHTATLQFIVN